MNERTSVNQAKRQRSKWRNEKNETEKWENGRAERARERTKERMDININERKTNKGTYGLADKLLSKQ